MSNMIGDDLTLGEIIQAVVAAVALLGTSIFILVKICN